MKLLDTKRLSASISNTVNADIADGKVGCAGISVVQNGKEVFREYFGHKSAEDADRLTVAKGDKLMFRLASMTKPITTVAALILVSKGKLELDTPINRILPAFDQMNIGKLNEQGELVFAGEAKTKLTVRMLLNHTSGIGTGLLKDLELKGMNATHRQSLKNMIDFLPNTMLAFEPGTSQMYSPTLAFDILARIIEIISNKPFDLFVKEYITDPCGMTDTTFAPTEEQWGRFVSIHNRVEMPDGSGGKSIDVDPVPGCVFQNTPTTYFCGGAGLASTLPDYVRFAKMLCNGGVTDEGIEILPSKYIKAMGTATVSEKVMPGIEKWGLGVRVIAKEGHHMPKNCFGWSGMYGSHFWIDPENKISAIYMKNGCYDGGAGSRTSINFEKDVYGSLIDK